MTIKIELEEREWEVITRLIREEVNFNGSYEREEDQKFWNGLVDKLIDSKIMEGGLAKDNDGYPFKGMTVEEVFDFLKMEKR